ncbi:MAG: ABC transporter permease, partial [Candidatus Accumulibacter sp.]|nr:ABC transporter permease [Accumulibacter sp.]
MNLRFIPVPLLSDVLVWLLVAATISFGVSSKKKPLARAAWRRIGKDRPGIAAATILAIFVIVGLLDSLHYRKRLEDTAPGQPAVYAVGVLSVLDAIAAPLRERNEKTYSAPLATRSYAKETIEARAAGGRSHSARDFPRLEFGGSHLGEDEAGWGRDVLKKFLVAEVLAAAIFALLAGGTVFALTPRSIEGDGATDFSPGYVWRAIWRGETEFSWSAVLSVLGAMLFLFSPIVFLCVDYHVFGTDKVGQDVFYQILKSVRTALVIGLVTTLATLPLAVLFGIFAGYFRGWIDDV